MNWMQSFRSHRPTIAAAGAIALVATAGALIASGQVFVTAKGQAENGQYSLLPGNVYQITYDLISDDPRAVFSVTFDASDDDGKNWNVRPRSVAGDVGSNVTPGRGKKITWEIGKDVETPQFDRFRFRVTPVAGTARPTAGGGGGGAGPAARTGRLSITSTPSAAIVVVDGERRGTTPLVLPDLPEGEHKVTLQKAGYLDNQRAVQVRAGAAGDVAIQLTAVPAATATPDPGSTNAAGGGSKNKIFIALGAAGAVGGALAAS